VAQLRKKDASEHLLVLKGQQDMGIYILQSWQAMFT
jgi:hypothetical protein